MSGDSGSIVKDSSWEEGAWTQVPNDIVRDRALSLEAKGLILYLASHSVNYEIHLETLRLQVGVGRDKLQRVLKELETAGYLKRQATFQMIDGRNRRGPNRYELSRSRTSVHTTRFQATETQTPGNKVDEPVQTTCFEAPEVQATEVQAPENQASIKKNNSKKNNQKKIKTDGAASAASTRGTRLPEDFKVSSEMVNWFNEKCPSLKGQGSPLTEQFRDYYRGQSGQRGVRVDWEATWRSWMRNAVIYQQNRRPGARISTMQDPRTGAFIER